MSAHLIGLIVAAEGHASSAIPSVIAQRHDSQWQTNISLIVLCSEFSQGSEYAGIHVGMHVYACKHGVAWRGVAWRGMAWHGMPSVVLHRFVFSLRCTCIVLSCIRVVFQLRVM